MKYVIKIVLFLNLILFFSANTLFAQEAKKQAKPNIIFILADDLGFEALGTYGAKSYKDLGQAKTPNLDRLAAKGVKFTRCFATPVCSPARAEFFTGKYNFKVGFPDIAGRNGSAESLDSKVNPTIAQHLKKVGYTTAVCGKWHIGPPDNKNLIPSASKPETEYPHPQECGFDRQSIFSGGHLNDYGQPKAETYTPAIIHNWALAFLKEPARKEAPFFLYYASPIPHVPHMPTPLNPNGIPDDKSNFPFLIEFLDGQIGEIMQTLESNGLAENTILMFSADNGTASVIRTQMADGNEIKGGKASMKDVGSQVPLLAMWPGKITKGSICSDLIDFSDLMPTLLKLAGAPIPQGIDGVSFAEQLLGRKGNPRTWIHVHFDNQYFVRSVDYKLREDHQLYSMKQAPYNEIHILPENDNSQSKAARKDLQIVMNQLYKGYIPPIILNRKKIKKE